jgi:cytochrome P450 / NADPH-cytochrome P450 reductase
MKDIANQLVLKWARKGSDFEIPVTEDYTRLTLDTIALCTMNYRFNSFYQDAMHPYVAAMMNTLEQAGTRSSQPAIVSKIASYFSSAPDTRESSRLMRQTAQEIIESRRNSPTDKPDFLNTLLYGKDPKTGEQMRDELIASEMTTFLVAGHETTSGLLSFATLFLLQNPAAYRKAQQEVDSVIGNSKIEMEHLRKLKYIDAVLKETLRLCPTAPALSKMIHPNRKDEFVTIAGGKYHVENTDRIAILLSKAMQDPKVFGEDAREFKPERMLEGNPNFQTYQQYWKVSYSIHTCELD